MAKQRSKIRPPPSGGLFAGIEGIHVKLLRPSGGCHSCPRARQDFVPPTLTTGDVLWLGEAPGKDEVTQQEGFVGISGQRLRRTAREAGVPEPWSFSNTIHCRPPNNATPHPREIDSCLAQFVLDEIRGYRYVVMAGTVPLTTLFPGAQGTHFRGNVAHHPDFPGQRFYSIYHPAYIERRRDAEDEFVRQLQRLARLVRGEAEPTWKVVDGPAGLAALEAMTASPFVSLDIETNSLYSWKQGSRLVSMAATVDEQTVAVIRGDDPHWQRALDLTRAWLDDPARHVIGANVGFDVEWLERMTGRRALCQTHDVLAIWTQAAHYKMPSLKELVAKELDGYRYLIHEPHATRDMQLLTLYNAEDVVHSLALWKRGIGKLRSRTRDLVTRVTAPASLNLQRVTTTGIWLNREHRERLEVKYTTERRDVLAAWRAEDPRFVPDLHESGNGLHAYLWKIVGLPIIERTEKGDPSTDAATIKMLMHDHGALQLKHLLRLREIDKMLGTYIRPYDKHVGRDNRIHSNYTMTWTDSGRSSSRTPNLQNVPRLKEIRDLFSAPPGRVLLESDMSQIEFRIMVCLARDKAGIAGYLRGEDAHTMTARAIVGTEPNKEQRSMAKPVNFALLYGGDEYTVRAYAFNEYGIEWSQLEASRFVDAFFGLYEDVPKFHDASRQRLKDNRGHFESVVGHTWHYPDWDSKDDGKRAHAYRSALNAEAQGPAAQLCLYSMTLARQMLDERGLEDVLFVNHVHDSIMSEVPDDDATIQTVMDVIDEATERAREWVKGWFVIPMPMGHAFGPSWGSLDEVKALRKRIAG